MKKKKYDRPFVEVLTLETINGMMAGSPGGGNGDSIDKIESGNSVPTTKPRSMKRPSGSSAWEDDSEIENDDMGYKSYD